MYLCELQHHELHDSLVVSLVLSDKSGAIEASILPATGLGVGA